MIISKWDGKFDFSPITRSVDTQLTLPFCIVWSKFNQIVIFFRTKFFVFSFRFTYKCMDESSVLKVQCFDHHTCSHRSKMFSGSADIHLPRVMNQDTETQTWTVCLTAHLLLSSHLDACSVSAFSSAITVFLVIFQKNSIGSLAKMILCY